MIVQERAFIFVSALIAGIGLLVLFVGVQLLEEHALSYDEFLSVDSGVRIVVEGDIKKITRIGNTSLIDLTTRCSLPLVLFENVKNLRVDDQIRVIGTKKFYEGKPEVLVEKIIVTE